MLNIRIVLLTLSTCVLIYFTLLSGVYPASFIFSWTNSNVERYTNDLGNRSHVFATEDTANLTCLAGIVYGQPGGRLANRLMEYASTWSLAILYNLTPVVKDDMYSSVTPLFTKLSIPPASTFIEKLRERDPHCAKLAVDFFLKGIIAKPDTANHLESSENDKYIQEKKSREPIVLRPYIILVNPIARLQAVMKEEFRYRPKYNRYAQRTLRRAAAGLKSTVLEEKIAYVGVHVRRTDYLRHLSRKYGLKSGEYADIDYYDRAMEYMLKRLRNNGVIKVVFAVASDDEEWTKQNLIPELEKNLESRGLLGRNATVSWCGSEDPINDLVLLSACNHSIIAYGTYGSWSALMAGGWTVVYDINPRNGKKRTSTAMIFARALSNWTSIH